MVGDSSPHEPHYPLNTGNVDYRAEVLYLARDMVSGEPVIGPVSGSRYMARLRATGADWGLDTRIRCGFDKHLYLQVV